MIHQGSFQTCAFAVLRGSIKYNEPFFTSQELEEGELVPVGKQHTWLLGRLAAKRAARVLLFENGFPDYSDRDIEVGRTKSGPPSLRISQVSETEADLPQLQLSITHTHDVAGAMVSLASQHTRIGVDIERIRSFNESTTRAFLTNTEYAEFEYIELGEERLVYLTRLWCMKEAYLKAIGTGLRTRPNRIEVCQDGKDGSFQLYYDHTLTGAQVHWTILEGSYIFVYVIL